MLREILYGETYDKSPSVYSKIREKGGEEIYQSAWSENPPNLALGRLSWATDFEVSGSYQKLYNQHGVPADILGCFPG